MILHFDAEPEVQPGHVLVQVILQDQGTVGSYCLNVGYGLPETFGPSAARRIIAELDRLTREFNDPEPQAHKLVGSSSLDSDAYYRPVIGMVINYRMPQHLWCKAEPQVRQLILSAITGEGFDYIHPDRVTFQEIT